MVYINNVGKRQKNLWFVDTDIIPPKNRLDQLFALGIPTEFHSYSGLPHGFGLGTGTVAEGWIQDAIRFWQRQSGVTAIQSPPRPLERGLGGEAVYSLNGTRRDTMQRGINIVDGRKVVR